MTTNFAKYLKYHLFVIPRKSVLGMEQVLYIIRRERSVEFQNDHYDGEMIRIKIK